MSPAYDIVSSNLAIPEEKDELALTVNGRIRKLRRKDFFEFGGVIGLQENFISDWIEKCIAFSDDIFELTDKSSLPEQEKNRFKEIVRKRLNCLE